MPHERALALRDCVARPVLEQLQADLGQLNGPARRILEALGAGLFSPELRISAVVRASKAKGTRSLEDFAALTAVPPFTYLLEARGEVAQRLLIETELSIDTISGLVGFGSADVFCRSFRRRFGQSPSSYRAKAREAQARGARMPDPAWARRR
ncbi:MAG: helix-turn-helix transcriptional regulator, partial [Thermoanaerobaculia bacterium]|nr:helix-turn-helix transcriptional regulator [Thermoanaerobaculia bacterium]